MFGRWSKWDIGDTVRVIRNVRNDGTFGNAAMGDLLIRRGSLGTVVDIGTFLQRYYIYAVDWVERGTLVGMRGRELVRPADLKITSGEPA